jgi:uncharacterized membrane protein
MEGLQLHSIVRVLYALRSIPRLAEAAAGILLLASTSLADVRQPYFTGRDAGTSLILLGFFLSLSIAAAGIWFAWYRRRGGSRRKAWIIAAVIAVVLFIFIGIATTLAASR